MTPEQTAAVLEFLETMGQTSFASPVPLDAIGVVGIQESGGRRYLQVELIDPPPSLLEVASPIQGFNVGPEEIGRSQSTPAVVLRLDAASELRLLGFFEYVVISQVNPTTSAAEVAAGAVIGQPTAAHLELEFLKRAENGIDIEVLNPAIVTRMLALFNDGFLVLLAHGLVHNDVSQFDQSVLISTYDSADVSLKRILLDAINQEVGILEELGLPVSSELRTRADVVSGETIGRDALRDSFDVLVAADPDFFVLREIPEMRLHVAIMRADQYEVHLIDLDGEESFDSLADPMLNNKLVINGPYYSLVVCEKPWAVDRAQYYLMSWLSGLKGMKKGNLKMRGGVLAAAQCPGSTTRYYFQQNTDRSFEFGSGVLTDSPALEVGLDNLSGIILDGVPVISDVDYSDFREKEKTQGMPFCGWIEKNGVNYFLVAMRRDGNLLSLDQLNRTATFDQIVDYLLELGAQDVLWTDGDDSVGMIAEGQQLIRPGWKKHGSMPLAIAFRRI